MCLSNNTQNLENIFSKDFIYLFFLTIYFFKKKKHFTITVLPQYTHKYKRGEGEVTGVSTIWSLDDVYPHSKPPACLIVDKQHLDEKN